MKKLVIETAVLAFLAGHGPVLVAQDESAEWSAGDFAELAGRLIGECLADSLEDEEGLSQQEIEARLAIEWPEAHVAMLALRAMFGEAGDRMERETQPEHCGTLAALIPPLNAQIVQLLADSGQDSELERLSLERRRREIEREISRQGC